MSSMSLARRSVLVVAGALALVGASSTATAQRAHPRPALGPPPTPPAPTTPYPGATVTIDPRWYSYQPLQQRALRHQQQRPSAVYYVPVPSYQYYPAGGYGGGVYDTNGRPLSSGFDAPAPVDNDYPAATPDLSGSPYAVIDGGTMIVDFGNGDRRAVPSCAVVEQAGTPDGQPRTLFYHPPAYGLVLRPGQRGQVLGRPTAGARVCYTNDRYGRVVLDY
jgi:hypothetical protein